MKPCPYCNFQNPDEAMTCLSCKNFRFEIQCPFCQSWRVIPKQAYFKGDTICLDCNNIFFEHDVKEKQREIMFTEQTKHVDKISENFQKIDESYKQTGEIPKDIAIQNLKDIFSPIKNITKTVSEDFKVKNDPRWQAQATIHKSKIIASNKIADKIFSKIGIAIAFATFILTQDPIKTLVAIIICTLIYTLFFRKKLLQKTSSILDNVDQNIQQNIPNKFKPPISNPTNQ